MLTDMNNGSMFASEAAPLAIDGSTPTSGGITENKTFNIDPNKQYLVIGCKFWFSSTQSWGEYWGAFLIKNQEVITLTSNIPTTGTSAVTINFPSDTELYVGNFSEHCVFQLN